MIKKRKIKVIIWVFVVFLSLIISASVATILLSPDDSITPPDSVEYDFDFYEPDYEADILSDDEYLSLDRSFLYKIGAVTTVLDGKNGSSDRVVEFIADYINTLIMGDYESYSSFFSEKYKSNNEIPEKFTMQRIYNITIEKLDEEYVEGHYIYTYWLKYSISKNDGTLRSDMGSDASKPQYLIITEQDGSFLIDEIYYHMY